MSKKFSILKRSKKEKGLLDALVRAYKKGLAGSVKVTDAALIKLLANMGPEFDEYALSELLGISLMSARKRLDRLRNLLVYYWQDHEKKTK